MTVKELIHDLEREDPNAVVNAAISIPRFINEVNRHLEEPLPIENDVWITLTDVFGTGNGLVLIYLP
jgi:serine kinase of HPr protein (carbohydrate metabolism regulator)